MILVGGRFDYSGGRASKIIGRLGAYLECETVNGGTMDKLDTAFQRSLEHECVLWFPDVADDREYKEVAYLKSTEGSKIKCLVMSKVNADEYSPVHLIGKMLRCRANLMVEISLPRGAYFSRKSFRLLDPLGNLWCETDSVADLAVALRAHCGFLLAGKRARSVRLGEDGGHSTVDKDFLLAVNSWADQAAQLCAGSIVRGDRFFGAFGMRCLGGFFAQKLPDSGSHYYVSARNTDKRTASPADTVLCVLENETLSYWGERKPSLDAASFIKIMQHFDLKYCVHFHTYLAEAPYVDFVPCGDLRELDAFIAKADTVNNVGVDANGRLVHTAAMCLNVRGHGFFAAFDVIPKNFHMYSRPVFEDLRGTLEY